MRVRPCVSIASVDGILNNNLRTEMLTVLAKTEHCEENIPFTAFELTEPFQNSQIVSFLNFHRYVKVLVSSMMLQQASKVSPARLGNSEFADTSMAP